MQRISLTRALVFFAITIGIIIGISDTGSAFAQNRSRLVRPPEYGQIRHVHGQTLIALKPGTAQCPRDLVWETTCLSTAIEQMRQLRLSRASGFLPSSETYDGAVRGEIVDIVLEASGWSAQWRLEGAIGVYVPKQCAALPGEGIRYTRGYEDRIDVIRESQIVVCNGPAPSKGAPWIPQGETIPARAPLIGPAGPPAWPIWPAAHYPIVEGPRLDIIGIEPGCPTQWLLKDGLCFRRPAEMLAAQIAANPKMTAITIFGSAQSLAAGTQLKAIEKYELKQKKKGLSASRKYFSGYEMPTPPDCTLSGEPEYLVEGEIGKFQVHAVQTAACGGPPPAPKGLSVVEFYGYAYPVARPGNCDPADRLVGGNLCFGAVKSYMQSRGIDRLQAVLLYENNRVGTVLEHGKHKYDFALVTTNPEYTEFKADRRASYSTGLQSDSGCRSPASAAPRGVIVQGDGTALYWEWKECPE